MKENSGSLCVGILVGNKYDLCEEDPSKRMVNYEDAQAFALENNLLFTETSALANYNIEKTFEELAKSKTV